MIEQHYGNVRYLQFNLYRSFPEIVHGVFTRAGGYSEAPYASLNTSSPPGSGGDSFVNVIRNRQLVLQALGMEGKLAITLWQVHEADILTYPSDLQWRSDWASASYYERKWAPQELHKGDGLLSQERGVAFAMSFADCTPIVFYDPSHHAIGIVHGGWRGTARGIVLATIEEMRRQFASEPEELYVGIGPAIGACCYEVSETVRRIFLGQEEFETYPTRVQYRDQVRESAVFSTQMVDRRESLRLDVQKTHRNQLLQAGVLSEHIETMNICTACNTNLFFSHRAEQGKTGRFVVVIALAP